MPTDQPTADEVRELLQEIERSPKFGVVIWNKVVPSSTLAALCRAFLAQPAKTEMTAGEFANGLAATFRRNISHKRGVEESGMGRFAPITSEGWEIALGHLIWYAREHNIEIVEPKK